MQRWSVPADDDVTSERRRNGAPARKSPQTGRTDGNYRVRHDSVDDAGTVNCASTADSTVSASDEPRHEPTSSCSSTTSTSASSTPPGDAPPNPARVRSPFPKASVEPRRITRENLSRRVDLRGAEPSVLTNPDVGTGLRNTRNQRRRHDRRNALQVVRAVSGSPHGRNFSPRRKRQRGGWASITHRRVAARDDHRVIDPTPFGRHSSSKPLAPSTCGTERHAMGATVTGRHERVALRGNNARPSGSAAPRSRREFAMSAPFSAPHAEGPALLHRAR